MFEFRYGLQGHFTCYHFLCLHAIGIGQESLSGRRNTLLLPTLGLAGWGGGAALSAYGDRPGKISKKMIADSSQEANLQRKREEAAFRAAVILSRPEGFRLERLAYFCRVLSSVQLEHVEEERALAGVCGLALCSNSIESSQLHPSGSRMRISSSQKKIFVKKPSIHCSTQCALAAAQLRLFLNETLTKDKSVLEKEFQRIVDSFHRPDICSSEGRPSTQETKSDATFSEPQYGQSGISEAGGNHGGLAESLPENIHAIADAVGDITLQEREPGHGRREIKTEATEDQETRKENQSQDGADIDMNIECSGGLDRSTIGNGTYQEDILELGWMAEGATEEKVTSAEARNGLSPFAKAHLCLATWTTRESREYIQTGLGGQCKETNSLLEGEILRRVSSALPKAMRNLHLTPPSNRRFENYLVALLKCFDLRDALPTLPEESWQMMALAIAYALQHHACPHLKESFSDANTIQYEIRMLAQVLEAA